MLDDPVDELGLRRVKLDWRLSPIDKRSARFMLETFAAEVGGRRYRPGAPADER